MINIKMAYAVIQGQMHVLEDLPCQDKISLYKTETHSSLVLCDGAGSCPNSELVAQLTTQFFSVYLVKNFEFILRSINTDEVASLNSTIIHDIYDFWEIKKIPTDERACTLLATVISEDGRWICVHIGDGGIFLKEDSGIMLESNPQNGEFSNITYFVSDPDSAEHLEIKTGYFGSEGGFLLTSDGCFGVLSDANGEKIAGAVEDIFEWIKTYDEDDVKKALEANLQNVFFHYSDDDMSIGLLWYSKNSDVKCNE